MNGIPNVSQILRRKIKRTSQVYPWTAAGSVIVPTSKSNSYSISESGLEIGIDFVFGKKTLAQRRYLCSMARRKYRNKKPPLTHFLCLPLLTTTSIPRSEEHTSELQSRQYLV